MRTFILLSLVAAASGQRTGRPRGPPPGAAAGARGRGGPHGPHPRRGSRGADRERAAQPAAAADRSGGAGAAAKALEAASRADDTIAREAPLVAEFSTHACATAPPLRPHGLTPDGARLVFEKTRRARRYFEWGPGGGAENFPRAMAKAEQVVSVGR